MYDNSAAPLISIIVPVYNVADFLIVCLDSLVNQSYQHLEIILIDDGSTDNSGKICDEYESRDSRVIVVHKENQGLAQARNTGIEMVNGDYTMFVDSDDWIDTEMCESMLQALSKHGVQAAMCTYIREYPDRSLPRILYSTDVVFDGPTFCRRLCGPVGEELSNPERLDCFNTMWGKLYPTHALKKVNVTDLSLIGSSEDLLFNVEFFSHIENVVCITKPFYHYRKRPDTSISVSYKPDLEKLWDYLYDRLFAIIQSERLDDSCVSALNNRIALDILSLGLNTMQSNADISTKCRRIKHTISAPRRSAALMQLPLKDMPVYWKAFYFSARHKFAFSLYILLMIIERMRGKV